MLGIMGWAKLPQLISIGDICGNDLGEDEIPAHRSMLHFIRCKINFSLLHSSILCIQGARSRCGTVDMEPYALQIVKNHIKSPVFNEYYSIYTTVYYSTVYIVQHI